MNVEAILGDSQTDSTKPTRQFIYDTIIKWLQQAGIRNACPIDDELPLHKLGIDSLGIMEIAGQLEQGSGKKLNPEMLFELETIGEIAEYMDSLAEPVDETLTASRNGARHETMVAPPGEAENGRPPDRSLLTRYQLLNRRINSLKEEGRYFFEPVISQYDGAWVVADGQRKLMLASYDYLGLLNHQRLNDSATEMIRQFGTGHHGARLLTGTTTAHRQLEDKLAAFMGTDDAIVFGSGYVTNLAVISALVGPGDCVIGDQWNHASIVDGCRMSCADFVTFAHNDVNSLAECLHKAGGVHKLVVVDAVYSMDGDIAPIREIIKLCRQYDALLMVDEAHSLGVLGNTGRGIQEFLDLDPLDIDIKMGTLSKTLASSGGFVAACHDIVSYLRHHARGYIFSGALCSSHASAAMTALDVLQDESQLVRSLWKNVELYSSGLKSLGFDIGNSVSPIVPIMTADIDTTLNMAAACGDQGLLVMPVCYPAVPMDAPRLRTCVSAAHTEDEIRFALGVLASAGRTAGLV